MDFGVFKRSRAGVWLWIVVPAVLVAVVYGVASLYCRTVSRGVTRRKQVLDKLPELSRALERNRATLEAFPSASSDPEDAVPAFRARLNATAHDAELTVNSLSVEALTTGINIDQGGVRAAMVGEGSTASLVTFLNELQLPDSTVVVESMALGTIRTDPEPVYKATMVLRWCFGRES